MSLDGGWLMGYTAVVKGGNVLYQKSVTWIRMKNIQHTHNQQDPQ